ncbi:MAG: histone deacetylase [Candidatus Zixiibacteriota bacterium]
MKIIFSKRCLEYSQPGHPESPERVRSTFEHLKDHYEVVEPTPADVADLLLVHTRDLIDRVSAGNFYDGDSPAYPHLAFYARLSAGAALMALKLALEGTASISLMRPPGHHAGKNFLGGFCYFNNVAIAAAKALDKVRRVAIIDFDCHHGNGTQDIFMGSDRVLYVSLHQSPLYPGTGYRSELNCRNFPVDAFTSGDDYMKIFSIALDEVREFSPELVAVSAGFDTFKEDPITNLGLDIETFERIGEAISSLGVPTFSLLEGGYSSGMPYCVQAYLNGLES